MSAQYLLVSALLTHPILAAFRSVTGTGYLPQTTEGKNTQGNASYKPREVCVACLSFCSGRYTKEKRKYDRKKRPPKGHTALKKDRHILKKWSCRAFRNRRPQLFRGVTLKPFGICPSMSRVRIAVRNAIFSHTTHLNKERHEVPASFLLFNIGAAAFLSAKIFCQPVSDVGHHGQQKSTREKSWRGKERWNPLRDNQKKRTPSKGKLKVQKKETLHSFVDLSCLYDPPADAPL